MTHRADATTAIKDSVHDHVPIDAVAEDLLDTPTMQRLRHIKQLSTVGLVYPSANHTRFEHSLGVYHLAARACDHLGCDAETAAHVRAAALLHDVGHGPYGHQTEDLIERRTGRHHDEIGDLLERTEVGAVLVAHGLDPERVAALVRGDGKFGQLVSGELDVDRMDYLVRDAHHTGVPYGTVDHGRLIRALRSHDERLVLAEGNLQTAESLLVARALMNATVYRHHVSRIAGAMLERASERLLDGGLGVDEFRRFADHDLLVALTDGLPDLGRRIERRDLYKRAAWLGLDAVPGSVIDLDHAGVRAAEREIAAEADVRAREVILDVPGRPWIKESTTRIVVDGEVRQLATVSKLVGALRAAERAQWRLGVYATAEETAAVASAAESVLGLSGGVGVGRE